MPRPYGGARGAAAALRASEGGGVDGQGGRQRRGRAGADAWCLSAPSSGSRCSAFILPLTLLASSRVAGFLGSHRSCKLQLLSIYLGCMRSQILDGACPCRCTARERWPGTTHTFLVCSPSSAGSLLSAFLVLTVEAAACRWFYRIGRPRNTPGAWYNHRLMAAGRLVSLDAFPSRLLSGLDPGVKVVLARVCLRGKGCC